MSGKPKKSIIARTKSFLITVLLLALVVESVVLYRLYKIHIAKPVLVNIEDREILPMDSSLSEKVSRLRVAFKDTTAAAWAEAQKSANPEDAWFNLGYRPRADLRVTDESFTIAIDVPGVEPAELSVSLDGLTLTVTGIRTKGNSGGNVILRERHRGEFVRTFEVPGKINDQGIKATITDGVLKVKLPRGNRDDVNRAIKVESGIAATKLMN